LICNVHNVFKAYNLSDKKIGFWVSFLFEINKVKAGHKPGSVHSHSFGKGKGMGNHLSGTNVADSLKRLLVGTRSMAIQCP